MNIYIKQKLGLDLFRYRLTESISPLHFLYVFVKYSYLFSTSVELHAQNCLYDVCLSECPFFFTKVFMILSLYGIWGYSLALRGMFKGKKNLTCPTPSSPALFGLFYCPKMSKCLLLRVAHIFTWNGVLIQIEWCSHSNF